MVITSVTGSVNYVGKEIRGYVGNIHGTLRAVFPEVRLVPGDRVLLMASATPGTVTLDPRILSERYRSEAPQDPVFPPEAFLFWIQEDRIQFWRQALSGYAGPLNRDARPVAFVQFLTLLDLISSRKFVQSPLSHLKAIRFGWVLALWMGSLLVVLLAAPGLTVRGAPLTVIAITGFTAMAQEILCLYMYQAIQGYLYSRLGMVVALFMAGLAVGGWLGARGCPASSHRILRRLLWVQAFLTILCMGIPLGWVPALFASGGSRLPPGILDAAVGLWMVLVGAGTGATFPLACGLMGHTESATGIIAGKADAWDHLGAAMGALVAGSFLVPIFGLSKTGTLLTALQGSALVFLGLSVLDLRRRGR
jgi:spermidine synthase